MGIDPDGLLGGYSIAFDLLSKEYGWTDEVIMDLPIRTFRQKIAAINRRRYMERREQISLMSWQTRQLAQFIAAGYWVEGENKAVSQAGMLAFDKIEEAQLKEAVEQERNKKFDFDPYDQSVPEDFDMNNGSFEKIMGSLGDPSRWKK